jgi:DNA sulfur modification protein DndC
MKVTHTETLDRQFLDRISDEIRQVYLGDNRPWIIGYSGGKDSTTALQLIWYAVSKLAPEQRSKPVYIISSDTLVETPKIVDYIDSSLERMNEAARAQSLPFSAHKVRPILDDTFWVNLIGRGYPAPSSQFRWCTERLKIDPANAFILEKVADHGEAVVVLGVRKDESATRAQVMSLHQIKGSLLSRHTTLPNAFVYTPIKDFGTKDIWTYLLQIPSPWGNNNRDLVTMYRNAQAGECPLVVDTTTPSCGNSRFGCWVCTVVTRDTSMESMIDNGEDWMLPLLEFRNMLAATQDVNVKGQVRSLKRRNGQVMTKSSGEGFVYGPYKMDQRKKLLRVLLETQNQIRAKGPKSNETLITAEELEQVRRIWRTEEQDWEDSVPKIYREVTGEDLDWIADELPAFSSEERKTLDHICARHGVSSDMVAKLLDVERTFHAISRRAGVYQKISSVLAEEWRSEEAILASGEKSEE